MAFTLVGFSELQDSASLANITALPDQHVRVTGDDIMVPSLNQICGYYFVGPNLTQGQLVSPSLRRIFPIDVEGLDVAAEPLSPPNFHDRFCSPIALVEAEALNALAAEDGAGATRETALVWLTDGPVQSVCEPSFTIKATASVTLVAFSWTNGALIFTNTLPAGRYKVVGMRAQSAGLIAARLVFPGYGWRPGVIGFDSDSDIEPARFRYGNAGIFGEFAHDAPPTVDFLSSSADTSEIVHLDLIGPL